MLLFFIIFGGLILLFALYFFKLYREDKKIIDEYKKLDDQGKLKEVDYPLLSDKLNIPDEDKLYICGEHPFIPYIESYN
jgi:hypothetical protein